MSTGETDRSTHGEVVGGRELALPKNKLAKIIRRGTTESFHMNEARKAGATGVRKGKKA